MCIQYMSHISDMAYEILTKKEGPYYTVSQKNIPDIFDCNVKKDYRILIIFGTNIPETTCRQVTI